MNAQLAARPLADWVDPDLVLDALEGASRDEILDALSGFLERAIDGTSREEIHAGLVERERLGSTGVGRGFAIPHCRIRGIAEPRLVVARSRQSIDFDALDGLPVRIFFTVATPLGGAPRHLAILAAVARWLNDPDHGRQLTDASGRDAMIAILSETA